MDQAVKDTAGLGIFFWLVGYLTGIALFFTPYRDILGWILLVVFTPFTILITWWWFRKREHYTLWYYASVGMAWSVIAIVLDYIFIVVLFSSTGYYTLHIFLYYALMVAIPTGIGMYLRRRDPAIVSR